jgi:glyoxylase-like metal-dependent hydrolase (beta-lactamase superfamily II)
MAMEQLTIGKFTLTWLRGGNIYLDGGAMFGVVPKPLWSRRYPVNENNQVQLRTDPILVQYGGTNILIEAGIGNNKFDEKKKRNYGLTEESQVEECLAELGITTKDIDFVIMTHLHFDHVSGLTKRDGDRLTSTFENALIYSSQIEWDEMRSPNIRSRNTYWRENWEPIQEQVKTYHSEKEILPGLRVIHTGGHSAGHAIVEIESKGERLLHMADLMPTHAHQNSLWVMAYDDYPMTSISQKEIWIKEGLKDRVWFSFYHDAIYRAIKWNESGKEIVEAIERQ